MKKTKAIIEAILFAAGRPVEIKELITVLELSADEIKLEIQNMQERYNKEDRGLEIIKIENGYQLCSKKECYEYIYPILDNRVKPSISNAAMETLAIIAYNPKITRAEIETIRGVNSDGTIYKLLEYNLIEDAGKLDAPGRPTTYKTTKEFLKLFGMANLEELPELPRYKLDENKQIVIDELVENQEDQQESQNLQEQALTKTEEAKQSQEETIRKREKRKNGGSMPHRGRNRH